MRLEVAALEKAARAVQHRNGAVDPKELARSFGRLLDGAPEQRGYRVAPEAGEGARGPGEQMGAAGAGPRVVVAAYRGELEDRNDLPAARLRSLVEEGRLLVRELMGHLVSYYRRNAVPAAAALPPPAGRREEPGHG